MRIPQPPSETKVRTISGALLCPIELDLTNVLISDIAHALSHIPRYGGHLPFHYSVAEHSIWVADYVRERTDDRNIMLQALMHDATEAFMGDLAKPFKDQIPGYKRLEDKLMEAMGRHFGFDYPFHPLVKEADQHALNAEWYCLMMAKMKIVEYTNMDVAKRFVEIFDIIKNEMELEKVPPIADILD